MQFTFVNVCIYLFKKSIIAINVMLQFCFTIKYWNKQNVWSNKSTDMKLELFHSRCENTYAENYHVKLGSAELYVEEMESLSEDDEVCFIDNCEQPGGKVKLFLLSANFTKVSN